MEDHTIIFVGLDVSKDRHAVAVAEGGHDGAVLYFGEIGSDDAWSAGRSGSWLARASSCSFAMRPGRPAMD